MESRVESNRVEWSESSDEMTSETNEWIEWNDGTRRRELSRIDRVESSEWNRIESNGMEWNRMESNRMESSGMDRMEWNRIEWNGIESNESNRID